MVQPISSCPLIGLKGSFRYIFVESKSPKLPPCADQPVVKVDADLSPWSFEELFLEPLREILLFKPLISNIISRDLKIRYKRSFLGIGWTLLAPLGSMIIMWAVFTIALKVQIPFYAVYLFSGMIVWAFFLQSSAAGCQSLLNAASLIRKVRIPRSVFPVTVVVNNALNFTFAFLALLIVIWVSGAPFHWQIIATPLVLLPALVFTAGWSLLVSSLSVFFRDLQYILDVGLGALFYLTPILYQPSMVPEKYHWIVSYNPLAKFIYLFRNLVYDGILPDPRVYLVAWGMSLCMFCVGWVVFHRLHRKIVFWL